MRYAGEIMWTVEDHTADALLVISARSWHELLAEAVRAFGSWMAGGEAPAPVAPGAPVASIEREIQAAGFDATETWVRLWRGLVRLWAVDGLLALEGEVERGANAGKICVRVRCAPVSGLDTSQLVDVKAVTWHRAEAGHRADGTWRGTIVLDI